VTTAGFEHVDLDSMWRRLEEDYERHTQLLANARTSAAQSDTDQLIGQQLIARSRQALADIATAIQAIVDGRYGVCGRCAGWIAVERLEARPQAVYCVPCAARVDESLATARPLPAINPRLAGRALATRAASRPALRRAS
jgi:RNA polymerase-binding transcription factor DksA